MTCSQERTAEALITHTLLVHYLSSSVFSLG